MTINRGEVPRFGTVVEMRLCHLCTFRSLELATKDFVSMSVSSPDEKAYAEEDEHDADVEANFDEFEKFMPF